MADVSVSRSHRIRVAGRLLHLPEHRQRRRDDRIIQRLHDFHEKKHARIQAAQQLVPQEEHAELLSELPTRVKDRLKK